MSTNRHTVSRGSVIRRIGLLLVVAGFVVLGWTAVRLWLAWGDVQRFEFETAAARAALANNPYQGSTTTIPDPDGADDEGHEPLVEGDPTGDEGEFARATALTADEAMTVYMIIGSDQRDSLGSSRRADVILLFIVPTDGSTPVLTSIPRDLYLANPCTGGMSRVNANLNGCGSYATGPEQVAIAVEDYTGVSVDHFIVFDFEGFTAVVDRVGGVEICVEYPVRDLNVKPNQLSLPAGCSTVGGDQALSWVRSRKTEALKNGVWQHIGANDLTRNDRQQDLIVQALTRLRQFRDISELTALVEDVAPHFAIDANISLSQAISLAWNMRKIDPAGIARAKIPVANYIDPQGRYVLVPRATFAEVLLQANPGLAGYILAAD